jgi:hypothetical protein
MREQRRFLKSGFARARDHVRGNASQRAHPGKIGFVEGQRHKPRARGDDGDGELLGDVEGEACGPELWNRQAAGGDAQGLAFNAPWLVSTTKRSPRRTALTHQPVRSVTPLAAHSSSSMRTIFCDARAPSQNSWPSVFS